MVVNGGMLQIISPHNLYLNPILVVKQYQLWRLITNFLYFRKIGDCYYLCLKCLCIVFSC